MPPRVPVYAEPPDHSPKKSPTSSAQHRRSHFNAAITLSSNTLRSNSAWKNVSRQFVWSFLQLTPSTIPESAKPTLRAMGSRQAFVPHVDLYFNESPERFTNKPSPRLELLPRALSLTRQRSLARFWRTICVSVRIQSQAHSKNRALRRKARHRNRPLCSSRRSTHDDGPHHLRIVLHRSGHWPPLRHSQRNPCHHRRDWSLSLRISTTVFRAASARSPSTNFLNSRTPRLSPQPVKRSPANLTPKL